MLIQKDIKKCENILVNFLKNHCDKNDFILDIGAGNGLYYNLLNNYFNNIDGIEIYDIMIFMFKLHKKYKNIFNIDIKNFKQYNNYNVFIFGNIIEYFTIEEFYNILNQIKDFKLIIITIPFNIKKEVPGNPYEIIKQENITP